MASYSTIRRKLASGWRLSWGEKLGFAVLYPLSGLVRLALIVFPFRALARCLGRDLRGRELSPLVSDRQLERAWRIGRLCRLVARYTPWETKCLAQALMARAALGLCGIPYVLYLGVAKASDGEGATVKAHAWVRVGPQVITGGEGHQAFTVLGSYAAPSLLGASVSAAAS